MAMLKFKRGEGLLVTFGEFKGAAVRFRRWAKNRKSITVALINDFRIGDHTATAGAEIGVEPHGVLRSAKRVAKAQTTRLLLAYCPSCQYKIRASASTYYIGVPPCPNPDCELLGHTMEVDWPDDNRTEEQRAEDETSAQDSITRQYQKARKHST